MGDKKHHPGQCLRSSTSHTKVSSGGKERTPDRRRIIFSRNRHHQRRGNALTVSKSTGHAILDQAAIFALRQWRFAPHSAVEVSVPITFSMDSRSPTPTGKH